MAKKNVILLCGGGGTEHDISIVSAAFFAALLADESDLQVHQIEWLKTGEKRHESGRLCEFSTDGSLCFEDGSKVIIDFVIPVLHGHPGESGEVPALLDLMRVPYLGVQHESSALCFNKISTKLWLDTLSVPIVPFIYLVEANDLGHSKAQQFLEQYGSLYVKASSQGSSVGCFRVDDSASLSVAIKEAFELSPYVLLEQEILGRELEVSVYEYDGEVQASYPGEIVCPSGFYTYEEKYNTQSKTETHAKAPNVNEAVAQQIKAYAIAAFKGMNLRHLARIDFFLTNEGDVYLNEINTFPGHTEISMFPMMMKENGHDYKKFLLDIVQQSTTA